MPNTNPLIQNIKSQAQRLSRLQNIKLSDSYEIISSAIYHCPNYQDLRNRINNPENESKWLKLASITSSSGPHEISTLKKYIPVIVERLNSKVMCNTNRFGLTKKVYEIFGVEPEQDSFYSHFPNFKTEGWKPIFKDSIAPNLVVESHICLNNVVYRLVAINTFMPKHWSFKNQESSDIAQYLEPQIPDEFQICTQESKLWENAVHEYINAITTDPDDDFIEFNAPEQNLTNDEKRIQESIKELLEVIGVGEWDGEESSPIPITFDNSGLELNTYLVFGYPTSKDLNLPNQRLLIPPNKAFDNDSQVVIVDGLPISLEWISANPETLEHDDEYDEHFSSIHKFMSKQHEIKFNLNTQEDTSQLILFKPVSTQQIEWDLELKPYVEPNKEIWMVKVENSTLAEQVINKVAKQDLYSSSSKHGSTEIICVINQDAEKKHDLAISLEIHSERSRSFSNLTTSMRGQVTDDNQTLYITISPSFINLLKVINKDRLIKAMKNGLINNETLGHLAQVNDSYCEFIQPLPTLPEQDITLLNSFKLPNDFFKDPFSLMHHSRMSQYERQIF